MRSKKSFIKNLRGFKRKLKIILILIPLIITSYIIYGFYSSDKLTPEDLERKLKQEVELINSGNFGKIYDIYISPETKIKTSREEYIRLREELKEEMGLARLEVEVSDIEIVGNVGYVDKTFMYCYDENCSLNKRRREYRAYIYTDGHWYFSGESKICLRQEGYHIPEEFSRAFSLIMQRLEESHFVAWNEFGRSVQEIYNCLNIQYARSESEIGNAEGVFYFMPDQSPKELNILVSPRYRVKDDLITATLLIHEISHVLDYLSALQKDLEVPCFETEANAFNNQNAFLLQLNDEERRSLESRFLIGGSDELNQIVYAYLTIPQYSGNDYKEKALNFVKDNLYYQEQCSNN